MSQLRFVALALLACSVSESIAATPEAWVVRTSPTTFPLNTVTFGNGLFVAVGASNTIITSSNGIEWTQRSGNGQLFSGNYAASYGNGQYVVGGDIPLLQSSPDTINWTNRLPSPTGFQRINGVAFGYGQFVAVGSGDPPNSSYILTSPNGVDWTPRVAPTNATLFAVTPALGAAGSGSATPLFVAVGNGGTILSSTNGVDWVLRSSGTASALRAVTFHQGRFVAAGDSGTTVSSTNGITWSLGAPASFTVRGLASDGEVVVAAGTYSVFGRVHASSDGLTWPGSATQFPSPLNGITYDGGSFVAVGNNGFIVQSLSGGTNEWLKSTSGNWEEPFWSLGPPSFTNSLVAFRNPGFKALAIGPNTTANYSNSLAVNYLTVDGPTNSSNLLLLNFAGTNVPLFVNSDFILGTNGAVLSYASALKGGSFYLSGPATFAENSAVAFSKIVAGTNANVALNLTNSSLSVGLFQLGQGAVGTVNQLGGSSSVQQLEVYSNGVYNLGGQGTLAISNAYLQSQVITPGLARINQSGGAADIYEMRLGVQQNTVTDGRGEYLLEDGLLRATRLLFINGGFTQTGGTNISSTISLPWLFYGVGDYLLSGGLLVSQDVVAGTVFSPTTVQGVGHFVQTGGVHSNNILGLSGEITGQQIHPYGFYTLSNGLFVSFRSDILGGGFTQYGGTNRSQELYLYQAGSFALHGGLLETSNTTVMTCCCVESVFTQDGGEQRVQNRLFVDGFVRYELQAGTLVAPNIEIGPGGRFTFQGGSISNSGVFTLRTGLLRMGGLNQQLGQLQVIGDPPATCISAQPIVPTLDLGGTNGPTTLRFRDSHDVGWSGAALNVLNWDSTTSSSGPDHVFVGTNALGLTSAQLSQIVFVNPIGLPAGNYSAQILATGEIVPAAAAPSLQFTQFDGGLVLSWSGSQELQTATNLTGGFVSVVGATSPYTNFFTDPQRFFRLQSDAAAPPILSSSASADSNLSP